MTNAPAAATPARGAITGRAVRGTRPALAGPTWPTSPRHRRFSSPAERGQATVELALLLPVIAIIVLVALELALLGRDQVLVVHAAREAARVGAVTSDLGAIEAAARAGGLSGLTVAVERDPAPGGRVVVHVTLTGPTRIGIGRVVGRVIVLEATATMRVEGPP